MADINDLKTAPAKATMNIVDPNLAASRKKPITATLGDIKEEDTNNAPTTDAKRVSDAVDMVTANTESELLNDGTRVINPKDIPNIKDPNAPEPRIMEDEVKEQLHDVITRKQQEAREEIQQMIAESEINERLAEENGITFDENGNAIGEDGQAATLSEDDELEAALDVELANMSAGRLNPPHEDDHEYEKVDDEEFDKVIGLDQIAVFHINDSMNPLGAHKDRHANIDKGTIGYNTLKRLIHDERFMAVPKILETPWVAVEGTDKKEPPYKEEIAWLLEK